MEAALAEQERKEYEVKHRELRTKKQELIQNLKEQRDMLLNISREESVVEKTGRSR